MDYETKAASLDAVFEDACVESAITRPALSRAQASDAGKTAFVNGYLRRGSEVELKSVTGTVAEDGGYAVPQEIDAAIDATLRDISPIRGIANVVKVGSAGYRKLVTTGGTPFGWAAENAARPRRRRRYSTRSSRALASFMPIRPQRRQCSTMRRSTSRLAGGRDRDGICQGRRRRVRQWRWHQQAQGVSAQ